MTNKVSKVPVWNLNKHTFICTEFPHSSFLCSPQLSRSCWLELLCSWVHISLTCFHSSLNRYFLLEKKFYKKHNPLLPQPRCRQAGCNRRKFCSSRQIHQQDTGRSLQRVTDNFIGNEVLNRTNNNKRDVESRLPLMWPETSFEDANGGENWF